MAHRHGGGAAVPRCVVRRGREPVRPDVLRRSDPRSARDAACSGTGGRLAVAVWDSVENIPAYAAEVALLARVAGQAAADALRAPFALGDPKELASLFVNAGVANARVETEHGAAHFPNVRAMVEADLRGWLPVLGVVLPEDQIARILEQAPSMLRSFVTADGTIRFDIRAHIVTGTNGHSMT